MKNYLSKNITGYVLVALVVFGGLTSCNKKLAGPTPITFPTQGTQTVLEYITSDTTFSYFLAAIKRAAPASSATPTLLSLLGDRTNALVSVYAPNNAAFRASGIPSVAAINAGFRTGQLDSLFRFHIIPGEQWASTNVTTTFPNVQLPSLLSVGAIPGTLLPFRLSVYPSRRATGAWFNTIPIIASDKLLNNGILHTLAALSTPPSLVLAQIIGADPNLTFFQALLNRGDVGVTDPTKTFAYALAIPFANLTVFAPNNTAVRGFIMAASGGAITPITPDANVIGFISAFLPAASAQGICAYHILGVKAFSVNFPTTATLVPTFVNLSVPTHPGVSIQAFFTGPFVDSLKVLGVAPSNGGIPATSKPRSSFDINAVNGVLHVIDKLLLPQ